MTLPAFVRGKSALTLLDQRKDGGRIRISTPGLDRDSDRVLPMGGRLESYTSNPVVQWGHQYWEPWQTIGRTTSITVSADGLDAEFELREPATDQDPQHIVLKLWNDKFINAASIGFRPLAMQPNDLGGMDFIDWELLEWSLVPIPANQEALRRALDGQHPLAAKAFGASLKAGRVLSAKNEARIRDIHRLAAELLAEVDAQPDEGDGQMSITHELSAPLELDYAALAAALLPELKTLLSAEASPAAAPASAAIDLTTLRAALRGLRAVATRN